MNGQTTVPRFMVKSEEATENCDAVGKLGKKNTNVKGESKKGYSEGEIQVALSFPAFSLVTKPSPARSKKYYKERNVPA